MTAMRVVDGQAGETLTEAAARRLREELAGKRISAREVSRRLHKGVNWAADRANGTTPMTTRDMQAIEEATGITAGYLVTGQKNAPGPYGPGANLQTKDYKHAGSHLRLVA